MANKPIIEIDVDDQKFKDFLKAFEKYKAAVEKLPGAWGKQGKEVQNTKDDVKNVLDLLDQQNKKLRDVVTGQKRMADATRETDKQMKSLSGNTKSVANNIKEATNALLRWSSMLGITGLGSLTAGFFGMRSMGQGAASGFRAASGMGMSVGQQKAYSTQFQRYVDPSFFSKIAEAQSSYAGRAQFYQMGINPEGKDVAALSSEVLMRSRELYGQNPNEEFLKARGALNFMSMSEMRQTGKYSPEELQQSINTAQRTGGTSLAIDEKTSKAWQDMVTNVELAGKEIDAIFVKGLVGFSKPLADLTTSVKDAITAFMTAPEMGKLIESAATGLREFADYVKSTDFKADVEAFFNGVHKIASAFRHIYGSATGEKSGADIVHDPGIGDQVSALNISGAYKAPLIYAKGLSPTPNRLLNPGNIMQGGQYKVYGSPNEGVLAEAWQLQQISRRLSLRGMPTTLNNILKEWRPINPDAKDPAKEAKEQADYIKNVSTISKIGEHQNVDLFDPKQLAQFMSGQIPSEYSAYRPSPEVIIKVFKDPGADVNLTASMTR